MLVLGYVCLPKSTRTTLQVECIQAKPLVVSNENIFRDTLDHNCIASTLIVIYYIKSCTHKCF